MISKCTSFQAIFYIWVMLLGISINNISASEKNACFPINLETTTEGLSILSSQYVYMPDFKFCDIDRNGQLNISDIIYPLTIQAKMITYEIHQKLLWQYLLKTGIPFISIEEKDHHFDIYVHPDGDINHVGFSWIPVPYLSERKKSEMELSIAENGIDLAFWGMINDNNGISFSFNLNVFIRLEEDMRTVYGEGNLQLTIFAPVITEEVPLYLFDLISPNINPVRISGKTAEQQIAFEDYWIADEEPEKNLPGFLPFLNVMLKGNNSNITIYPDFDVTISSQNTPVFFRGIYHSDQFFLIQPFVLITPGQNNLSIDYFFKSTLP